MKKVYSLLTLLLLFVSGAVQAYAVAAGWSGNSIKTVSDRLTSVNDLTDGYYLVRNWAQNYFICETGSNVTFTSSADMSNINAIQTAFERTDKLNSVVYVKKDATAGTYTLQFQSGNYLAPLSKDGQATTGATAENFTIALKSGTEFFTLLGSNGQYLDGNYKKVVGWDGLTSSNNRYAFYPVTLEDLHTLTYHITTTGGQTQTATYTYKLFAGETLPQPTGNYYTVSGAPEAGKTMGNRDENYYITLSYNSDMPFTISSSTDNAHWTAMKVKRDNNWVYASTGASTGAMLSTAWPAEILFLSSSTYANIIDSYLWAIVGNPYSGLQLVSKLSGKCMQLSGTGNGSAVTFAATTAANTYFDLVLNGGNWYVKKHGTTNGYINKYAAGNQLKLWNADANISDPGSQFVFTAADALPELTAAMIPTSSSTVSTYVGYVGDFDFTGAAASDLTGEALFDAFKVKLQTGVYYKIRASRNDANKDQTKDHTYADTDYRWISTEKTIASGTDGTVQTGDERRLLRVPATAAEVPMLWQFVPTTEGGTSYFITNANTGLRFAQYKTVNTAIDMPTQENENWAGQYTIEPVSGTAAEWNLKTNGHCLNAFGGCKDANYTTVADYLDESDLSDKGYNWYIIPTPTITLKVYNDTKWASVKYPFGVRLPEGLEAYIATTADNSAVTLVSIGSKVPANVAAFILDSNDTSTSTDETANYALTIDNTVTAETTDNKFEGTTCSRSGYTAGQFYGLAANNGTGKLLPNGASLTTVPANKAYLPTANVPTVQGARVLTFRFGQQTGIEGITPDAAEGAATTYYDLQGRRVLYPTTGVYVTDKGQKVYLK